MLPAFFTPKGGFAEGRKEAGCVYIPSSLKELGRCPCGQRRCLCAEFATSLCLPLGSVDLKVEE